jgi:signal transduction histidine kinase/CheY-like chemotaxis protein
VALVAFIFVLVTSFTTEMIDNLAYDRALGTAQTARVHLDGMKAQSRIMVYSVATNPFFLSIFEEGDIDAIYEFLIHQSQLFDITAFVVTDIDGKVVLRTHDPARYGDMAYDAPGIYQAREHGYFSSLFFSNPSFALGLSSVLPIRGQNGEVIGTLSASNNLSDPRYADHMAGMFNAEVAFFAGLEPVTTSNLDAYGNRTFGLGPPPHVAADVLTNGQERDGRVTLGNQDMIVFLFPLFGVTQDDVVGMFFLGFSHNEINEQLQTLRRIIALVSFAFLGAALIIIAGVLITFIRPLEHLTRHVLDVSEAPDESTEIYGYERIDEVGVLSRNIGQMRKNLVDLTHRAQAASTSKSLFLSKMSHEMRTPLNAITGMVSVGTQAPTAHRKQYALDRIGQASVHLLSVISDVLDMSKIEANMLLLDPVPFNFRQSIGRLIDVVRFRMDEKQQNLAFYIAPTIPRYLMGDANRYAQVLTNLMTNAIKFTEVQGIIELNMTMDENDDKSCFITTVVTDTGIGMTEEQQIRVFDLFEQADAGTTRNYGGTGLGLTIAKQIVTLMGGEINVKSAPMMGTTFSFTVKFDYVNEADYKKMEEASTTGVDEALFEGKRILLVEDIDLNREIVKALLEETKINVDEALDGKQAVEMFKAAPHRYDLIFMDIQMPHLNGYDATRQIRALEPKNSRIPIVAMTANVFREEIDKCLEVGMDDHISKPVDKTLVVERLIKWICVDAGTTLRN